MLFTIKCVFEHHLVRVTIHILIHLCMKIHFAGESKRYNLIEYFSILLTRIIIIFVYVQEQTKQTTLGGSVGGVAAWMAWRGALWTPKTTTTNGPNIQGFYVTNDVGNWQIRIFAADLHVTFIKRVV